MSTATTTQYQDAVGMKALLRKVQTIIDRVGKRPGMGFYMACCSGMIVLSATEYMLALSGQHGSGILIQHFKETNTWSNPSAIQMNGFGLGIQVGASSKDVVIFLSDHQVKTFANNAILRLGSQTGFAVGGGGMEGDGYLAISDLLHINASSAFAETKGWKFGLGLHAGVMSPMWRVNRDFYGDLWKPNVTPPSVPARILAGTTMKALSEDDKQQIKDLHDSLNLAIENKWIPKWYDEDENEEQRVDGTKKEARPREHAAVEVA